MAGDRRGESRAPTPSEAGSQVAGVQWSEDPIESEKKVTERVACAGPASTRPSCNY